MRIYKGHKLDKMLVDTSLVIGFKYAELKKIKKRLIAYFPEIAQNFSLTEIALQQNIIDVDSLELLIVLQYIDRLEMSGKYGIKGLADPFFIPLIMKRIDLPEDITKINLPSIKLLPNKVSVVYHVYQLFLSCLKTITEQWYLDENKRNLFVSREYIRQVQKSIVQYFFAEKIRLISEFNYLKHQYEKKDEEHKSYSIYWVLFVLKNEIEEYPPDMSDYNEDGVLVDIFFSTFRIIEDMIVIYKEKPYRYDTYQENQKIIEQAEFLIKWLKDVLQIYFKETILDKIQELFPKHFTNAFSSNLIEKKSSSNTMLKILNPVAWFNPSQKQEVEENIFDHKKAYDEQVRFETCNLTQTYRTHLFPTLFNPLYQKSICEHTCQIDALLLAIDKKLNTSDFLVEDNLTKQPLWLYSLKKLTSDTEDMQAKQHCSSITKPIRQDKQIQEDREKSSHLTLHNAH